MTLNEHGFAVVALPGTVPNLEDTFAELPADPYCPHRSRRFSQYRVFHDEASWRLERLEHRPLVQPRRFNSYVGGVLRHLQPIVIDVAPIVAVTAERIPLDRGCAWHFDVHQWRTSCDEETEAISVPEGPHQDGHEFGAVVVMARRSVSGGETLLYPLDLDEPFFRTTLQDRQVLLFDDRRLRHFTTNVQAAGGTGARDIFVFNINAWQNRKYGAGFEAAAAG
jgi:hypothetical protein